MPRRRWKPRLTDHHEIPKSMGGTNYHENIVRLTDNVHKAVHTLFVNEVPHQQLWTVIDIAGESLSQEFRNDFQLFIWNYDVEDMYNHKCVRMKTLLSKL